MEHCSGDFSIGEDQHGRPFYDLHADAYDALITDPVEPWVDAVDDHLRTAGLSSASVVDAGCGTGRHARALMDRGHRVSLLDASPSLLAIASRRCPDSPAHQTDICTPKLHETFQAITCRGVLNDLVSDEEPPRRHRPRVTVGARAVLDAPPISTWPTAPAYPSSPKPG
jgi:SAM-dependent methyltransferase